MPFTADPAIKPPPKPDDKPPFTLDAVPSAPKGGGLPILLGLAFTGLVLWKLRS